MNALRVLFYACTVGCVVSSTLSAPIGAFALGIGAIVIYSFAMFLIVREAA